MASGLALVRLEVRRRRRTAVASVLAVLAVGGVVAAYALPGAAASAGAGAALEAAGFVLAVVAGLAAVGAAASIPEDRASGAAEWLGATGAAAASRRLAPAAAAALCALAAGVAGGALVAVVGPLWGRAIETRTSTPLAVAPALLLRAAGPDRAAVAAAVDVGDVPADLEIDVRPVYRDLDAVTQDMTRLVVVDAAARDREEVWTVPARGTIALGVRRGAITLRPADPRVDLRLVAARRRGATVPFAANALLAGLVLGLALACAAPLAALLSRGTSTPTAAFATALLVVVGAARSGLLALAADAAHVAGGGPAAAVLRGATVLAPDLSALAAIGEAAAGRFVGVAGLAALVPALAHAAVTGTLLALLPARGGLS